MLSVTPDQTAILRHMKGRGGSDCGCALFVIVVTAFFWEHVSSWSG